MGGGRGRVPEGGAGGGSHSTKRTSTDSLCKAAVCTNVSTACARVHVHVRVHVLVRVRMHVHVRVRGRVDIVDGVSRFPGAARSRAFHIPCTAHSRVDWRAHS